MRTHSFVKMIKKFKNNYFVIKENKKKFRKKITAVYTGDFK